MDPTATPRRRPRHAGLAARAGLVALLLLAAPWPAGALPSGQSVGLSSGAGLGPRQGRMRPALALEADRWLEGAFDGVVAVRLEAAPGGGGAAVATPWLGLRWSPSLGRWRPWLVGGVGAGLPLDGWAPDLAVRAAAGLERLLTPELGLAATLGAGWSPGAGAEADLALGLRLYF